MYSDSKSPVQKKQKQQYIANIFQKYIKTTTTHTKLHILT